MNRTKRIAAIAVLSLATLVGASAAERPAPQPTKVQLLEAVRDHLQKGVSGLHEWVSPSPDDSNNLAFYHSPDASGLYPVLLAYMQAPPPGLGMASDAAQSKLDDLIRSAAAAR